MAILNFELEDAVVEGYSDCGSMLRYRVLQSGNLGWMHADHCHRSILGIQDVRPEEAANLWSFLAGNGSPERFRGRMAENDWRRLQTWGSMARLNTQLGIQD